MWLFEQLVGLTVFLLIVAFVIILLGAAVLFIAAVLT